jgi:hypothetical protein
MFSELGSNMLSAFFGAVSISFAAICLYGGKMALTDPAQFVVASPRFRRQIEPEDRDNPFVVFTIRTLGILLLLTAPTQLFIAYFFFYPLLF